MRGPARQRELRRITDCGDISDYGATGIVASSLRRRNSRATPRPRRPDAGRRSSRPLGHNNSAVVPYPAGLRADRLARAVLEPFLATDIGAECEWVEPADIDAYGKVGAPKRSRARCSARMKFGSSRARRSRASPIFWPSVTSSRSRARPRCVRRAAPAADERRRRRREAARRDIRSWHDPLSRLFRTIGRGGRLRAEQGEHIANGVHRIVVRSADNSRVADDSHHYAATPDSMADPLPVVARIEGRLACGEQFFRPTAL